MNHSFDIDVAKRYGVPEAIMIENFRFWIAKNEANNRHFHKGRYWTYNSTKAMTELFPYWNQKQIERIIKRLEDLGVLLSDNFNPSPYDRTKWFSLSEEIHFPKSGNGNPETGKTTKQTDINTDVNQIGGERAQAPATTPPAASAVLPEDPPPAPTPPAPPPAPAPAPEEPKPQRKTSYPADFEPNNTAVNMAHELRVDMVTAQAAFADHHCANGSTMADWQAAFRTWLRNAAKFAQQDAAKLHGPLETAYQRTMREKAEKFAPSVAKRAPQAPQTPRQSAADFFRTVDVAATLKDAAKALK